MTQQFRIKWPDGSETVEASETASPDAYAMERWGQDTAAALAEFGVSVELDNAQPATTAETPVSTPPVDAPPASTPLSEPTTETPPGPTETIVLTSSDVGDLNAALNP